jgi:hypothetical protein
MALISSNVEKPYAIGLASDVPRPSYSEARIDATFRDNARVTPRKTTDLDHVSDAIGRVESDWSGPVDPHTTYPSAVYWYARVPPTLTNLTST